MRKPEQSFKVLSYRPAARGASHPDGIQSDDNVARPTVLAVPNGASHPDGIQSDGNRQG